MELFSKSLGYSIEPKYHEANVLKTLKFVFWTLILNHHKGMAEWGGDEDEKQKFKKDRSAILIQKWEPAGQEQ